MNVPADCPQITVGNLHEGEECEFRIVVKNKAGKGIPSDPSDTIMATDINVPTKINSTMLNEIRIEKDAGINFNVNVEGGPQP
uniref:Fibronectin type-III domain-containing protein n=1 Tax=Ditylenchus dipsaci TaxID=166011 RepID=A0A915DC32_9BILA